MKQNRKNQALRDAVQRPLIFLSVLGLLLVSSSGLVSAAASGGQVQERSLAISDSAPSGGTIASGVGSGTNVTYRLQFKAASSYTIKGIVLDFCSGSAGTPFIGDASCDAPTDFTVGATPTIDTTTYAGVSGLGTGWTASSLNSGQTFYMSNSTGTALTSGTAYTFAISGVTNTSDLGTFFARVVTYTSDSAPASYTHGNPGGTYQDYGGFALSTSTAVEVTAKVQEAITFCMLGTTTPPTQTAPTDCADVGASAPAIILGHGSNNTLDATAVDSNSVYSFISTNALYGANIRIHNSNPCGGLSIDGGTTCAIPPTNAGAATTPATSGEAIIPGVAGFGLVVDSNADVAASAPYDGDPLLNYYGMDTTSVGSNAITAFGSTTITSAGPVNNVMNTWTFGATASNTTSAGIYTASIAAIATGTF